MMALTISATATERPTEERSSETKRPNVVIFLADDQGWGDLSLHGNPNLSTPRIDSIAREGSELTNFFVCPVCAPTRAEFLTGRYHPRSGVHGVTRGGERMNADERTIGEMLKSEGYRTAAYGKWHNGTQWPYHPNAQGFDDYYGFCSGHWGNYFSPMLEHNGQITKGTGFLVDDLTNHALDFISDGGEQPFFVCLTYNTPHSPMQVPDEYWDRFEGRDLVRDPNPQNAAKEDPVFNRAALAMCENIDWNVGRVLDRLDQSGLTDNTIVIYFSDNGPNSYRFNGGMRGKKGSVFEGGVRSPCLIRYPAQIRPNTTIDAVTGAIDLMPTLADLCDVPLNPPKPLDGHSIASQLTETKIGQPFPSDRVLVTHWSGQISARIAGYRYHQSGELYDLTTDPRETSDVSSENPQLSQKLSKAIADYIDATHPESANAADERPFTLGHPSAKYTQLPARDGDVAGGARRNNRHANCTFFENWRSVDDRLFWDIEVLQEGTFQVSMHYAVSQADVGATIILTSGKSSLTKTIDVANQTPLFGAQDDRTPRIEGYVKDWKPIVLGNIDLAAGPQRVSLRAQKIPGDEVAQCRLLMFERLK